MKKLYATLVLASFVFCTVQAQSNLSGIQLTPVPVETLSDKGGNSSFMVLDTFRPASFTSACFTGDATPLVYYNLGSAGYLAGTNSFGETECAQRYPFSGTGTISNVLVRYGKKVGAAGTTSAQVYAVDPTTKIPTTVMGTSSVITISNLPASGYTNYTFAAPVSVTTEFAVAAVLPTTAAAGDTVAIVSTKQGCSTDSMSYLNIAGFGGWNPVAALINSPGTPRDTSMDLLIRPIVDVAAGINEYPSSNGLTLKGVFPNPANDFTNIQYHIDAPAMVSMEIFDLTGRVIQQSSEKLSAGNHQIEVSLKDVVQGNYYYTIKTGTAELTSKFSVVR